jgi:hypothetical protein
MRKEAQMPPRTIIMVAVLTVLALVFIADQVGIF